MNTWKAYAIAGAVCLTLGTVGGGVAAYFLFRCNVVPPAIVDETPTETTHGPTPSTPSAFQACFYAPMNIIGRFEGREWLNVQASDGCKTGEKKFKLVLPDPGYKNIILFNIRTLGGYMPETKQADFLYGASLSYYRMVLPHIGVGGGVDYLRSFRGAQYGGVSGGILYQW